MKPVSERRVWAFVVVGMLTFCVTTQAILLAFATGDPSFAVERDYENKAAHWDDVARQSAVNARLGWSAEAQLARPARRGASGTLTLELRDRDGVAIRDAEVSFEACAVARANQMTTGLATPTAAGTYVASLPAPRLGRWEVRVAASRAGERFTATLRRDLASSDDG